MDRGHERRYAPSRVAKRPDDFPAKVVQVVRERAGGICTRPECNRLTIGPHSDPNKSKILGVAAHICGASPNGPRYDPTQTPAERKGIANAIWLCEQCGREVDKDTSPYPRTTLEAWKDAHERYISTVGGMGFRQAFLTAPLTQEEDIVARRIIAFFEDRRVLREILSNEIPTYLMHSVERIRDELWRWKADLALGSELARKIDFMRRACLEFLDDAGHLDSTERVGNNASKWVRLAAALPGFRKAMGTHVGEIAIKYNVPLPPDLAGLVPA